MYKSRFLIFVIMAIITTNTILASAKKDSDDGWTSTGGGEYIITQFNPWFMGNKPVTYCIDHGGTNKFSLNEDQAKIEIENSLKLISGQLKSINKHESFIHNGFLSPTVRNGWYSRYCGVDKFPGDNTWYESCEEQQKPGNALYLSDSFTYINNCNQADLQIILGNDENENVKKLIAEIGMVKFTRLVGIAHRTAYSQETLNGKGFIYIAADKGRFQYTGARNIKFKNQTIWDTSYKYLLDVALPNSISSNLYIDTSFTTEKIKDLLVGNLESVVTHELGHTFGLKHNSSENIMNTDYPATIVRNGLSFKTDYLKAARIFSNAQIESNKFRTINYNWRLNFLRLEYWEEFEKESKSIYDFIYNYKEIDIENVNTPIIFSFQIKPYELENEETEELNKSQLTLYTVNKLNGKYQELANYEWKRITPCQVPSTVDEVTVRLHNINPENGWIYNSSTNEWVLLPSSKEEEKLANIKILRLDDTYTCGKIFLKKNDKTLNFKLSHSYLNDRNELKISDPITGFEIIFHLQPGDQYDGLQNLEDGKIGNYFYIDPFFE